MFRKSQVLAVQMSIELALVEDDHEIRASLAALITLSSELKLVGQFASAEAFLKELGLIQPKVVLMDINLGGMNGIECIRKAKPRLPDTQFIMLTVYEDSEKLFEALFAGAAGYLLKRTQPDKLLQAIFEANSGGSPMTPQLARRVVQHFQQAPKAAAAVAALTPRELEVLSQLAQGYRYKEITSNLGISMDTVRDHIRNIYAKLHVHSRTEAVVKYMRR